MNEEKKKHLGEAIRRRREELGLTQSELALRLGYRSRSTINKIEKGINDISQSKLSDFAEALGTTPESLMFRGDAERRSPADELRFALATEAEQLDDDQLGDVIKFIQFLRSKDAKK